MKTRTQRTLVAAASLALFASACTDAPTTPTAARAPDGRALLSSSSGPTLVSTAIKYRDTGGKPARGRSGNAVMDAFAVLDKDGVTNLEFSTRHAANWWRYGYIKKVQIKASAPDGQHKFTRNLVESDPWYRPRGPIPGVMQLRGLGRGDQIRLQANVEGIDPPRVDVVTVTETVKRLPDLTVEMTAPAEAETNMPLNVLAVVRERNGDMGASGECQLYVGGEPVDYARGVWVDAGDAVTCAMTWTPHAPGTYPLEVRISSLVREWDTGNNSDTATLTVHGERPRFYTTASFEQTTSVDSSAEFSSWQETRWGYGREYRNDQFLISTLQQAGMYGHMPARTTGRVDLRVSMSSGGRVMDAGEWTYDAGDDTSWCTDHWSGRAMFWICSSGGVSSAHTDFSYAFLVGAVTFHSQGYRKRWEQFSNPDESGYHWNNEVSWDDTVPLGDDWTFDVRVNTAGGEHVVTRALQLTRSEPWSWSYPYSCTSWEDPEWGISSTYCEGGSYRRDTISGYAAD
jgi:hypothetical protein